MSGQVLRELFTDSQWSQLDVVRQHLLDNPAALDNRSAQLTLPVESESGQEG